MTKRQRILWGVITVALCLLPMVGGIWIYDRLPDPMPIHFNVQNQPDGFASKAVAVFGQPLLFAAIQAILCLCVGLNKRAAAQARSVQIMAHLVLPVVACVSMGGVYAVALGKNVDIGRVMCVLLGVLFFVIGNYLPKCRQNSTIGIRIPSTLRDAENWNKTHRLAGWLWMAGGVIVAVGTWVVGPIALVALLVMVIVPVVYSLVLASRKNA